MTQQKYTVLYSADEAMQKRPSDYRSIANSIYDEVIEKEKPNLNKVERFFKKWQQYPDVWTWYHTALVKNNRDVEADKLLNMLIDKFPDYYYGKIILANRYIDNEECEKAREILGNELDILNMQPGKTEIFYEDILKYYATYANLELALDNFDVAESILEKTKTEFPNEDIFINSIENSISTARLMIGFKRMKNLQSLVRKPDFVDVNDYDNYVSKPFFHAEIEDFCQNEFVPTKENIDTILALPRETLIQDLENIILKSIYEEDELETEATYDLVSHTIFFLTELKSTESLPVILQMLRQDDDYYIYWFGDIIGDIFMQYLLQLALVYPSELKEYAKEANRETYFKQQVFEAQEAVVFFYPEKRAEVLAWIGELLDFYYREKENEDILDTTLFGFIESVILNLHFKELLPVLEKFHKEGLIDEMVCGNIDDVRKEFEREDRGDEFVERTIYELFEFKQWRHHEKKEFSQEELKKTENDLAWLKRDTEALKKKEYSANNLNEPKTESSIKVGRNDPCPCGSGKKYKKCCGG